MTASTLNPNFNKRLYVVAANNNNTKKQKKKAARKHPIKKGRWSPDEDVKLLNLVKLQQKKNKVISWDEVEEAFKTRSKKQCRERWLSQLDPTLKKTDWSKSEDELLLELSVQLNKKWAEIARRIPGRTENMVKNRWHALRRQATGTKSPKRKKQKTSKASIFDSLKMETDEYDQLSVGSTSLDPMYPVVYNNHDQGVEERYNCEKPVQFEFARFPSDGFGRGSSLDSLLRFPSVDTKPGNAFTRQNSLELSMHPFGDKPDVILRNPSFELSSIMSSENELCSLDKLLWAPTSMRSFSHSSLGKQSSAEMKDFSLGNKSEPNLLEKNCSLDMKKHCLNDRQTSFGLNSLPDTSIDQLFLDDDAGEDVKNINDFIKIIS